MKWKFNLKLKFIDCLKSNPEKRFTAKEIADWIFEHYREDCERKRLESKQDLSDDEKLVDQIRRQITSKFTLKSPPKDKHIRIPSGKPHQFYWTEVTDEQEIEAAESVNPPAALSRAAPESKLSEHGLYPLLAQYLLSEMSIYTKRIDEKKSANNRGANGNKWLHPDIVGMEDASQSWHEEVKKCAGKFFAETISLSAYEVKLKLNSANIREAFFQTVSNSTWANYGYLVAAEIDSRIEPELRLLSELHGIGVILLNAEQPEESELMIASEERQVDWATASRIAEQNSDFEEYIICVRETLANGRIKTSDWDKPPVPEF